MSIEQSSERIQTSDRTRNTSSLTESSFGGAQMSLSDVRALNSSQSQTASASLPDLQIASSAPSPLEILQNHLMDKFDATGDMTHYNAWQETTRSQYNHADGAAEATDALKASGYIP